MQLCKSQLRTHYVIFTISLFFAVIPPCTPNPCLHSGVCSEVDITDYSCDCFGPRPEGYGSRFVCHSVHRATESSAHFFMPVKVRTG